MRPLHLFLVLVSAITLCASCSDLNTATQQQTDGESATTDAPSISSQTADPKEAQSAIESDEPAVAIEDLILEPSYRILGPQPKPSAQNTSEAINQQTVNESLNAGRAPDALCHEIGAKLGSVEESDCLRQSLVASGAKSVEDRDLAYKDYLPVEDRQPLGKVLVIGGIHGDEFSSVSVVFKWMDILNEHHSGLFHWRFIPASNPDGLLNKTSQRQNANGVDLNRNFPTQDWDETARDHWIKNAFRKPRRFPGEYPNSEPETQWLVEQIEIFQPDVIVSMHAPYHLVDYDGPPTAPNQLGSLYLRRLGVFPGSLGNYAGVDLDIPIVTVELSSAGIMPSTSEISNMWNDLVSWLRGKLS